MRTPPKRVKAADFIILGLDPSLTNFGFAKVDQDGHPFGNHTVVTKKLKGLDRIDYLLNAVDLECMPYAIEGQPPLIIVREDYAFAAHSSSDTMLKEFGGIMEYHLAKRWGRPLYTVGVAQVKKFVTGKGNAEKDKMLLAIYKNFGVEAATEHEADAVGVAFTAFGIITGKTFTRAQEDVREAAVKAEHPLTKLPK